MTRGRHFFYHFDIWEAIPDASGTRLGNRRNWPMPIEKYSQTEVLKSDDAAYWTVQWYSLSIGGTILITYQNNTNFSHVATVWHGSSSENDTENPWWHLQNIRNSPAPALFRYAWRLLRLRVPWFVWRYPVTWPCAIQSMVTTLTDAYKESAWPHFKDLDP